MKRRNPAGDPWSVASVIAVVLALVALVVVRPSEGIRAVVLGVAAAVALLGAWRSWVARGRFGRRYQDLEAVYDFSIELDLIDDTDGVVEATLRKCVDLFSADTADVITSRGVGSTITTLASGASPIRKPAPPQVLEAIKVGDGESEQMATWLSDAHPALRSHYQGLGVTTGMVSILGGGQGSGTAIVIGCREKRSRQLDELRHFGALAAQARVAFERVRLMDRLRREMSQKEHQVLHDSLTGLPNRLQFSIVADEALRRATDSGSAAAVLLIDLDMFKEINDTLGHQRGDVVLRETAMRLTEAAQGGEHVARLGGDEFGVILRSISGVVDAVAQASRFAEVVHQPLVTEGLTLQVTASIGIALAPEHGSDGPTLLRRAEIAMYEAKKSVAAIEVYDAQRDRYSTRRLALATELRQAIDSGALTVHYQPKARLTDGVVVGVEALARWLHSSHGAVPPDEFIELAERTGLIRPLTELVLRTALSDAVRLGADRDGLSVAVNIAPSSLSDSQFPELLAQVIGESNIDPRALVLEVTESTMMADSAKSRLVLEGLDELGVQLSVDDFGTGYSSLTYLSRLPVDEVKIDRSFVTDMGNDARAASIVRSTIALVHSLEMRVVAEGVEDRATWDLLRDAGCDLVQGYYLAKPMGFTDLSAWLEAYRADVKR